MRYPSKFLALFAVLVLAVVASACGGSKSDDGDTTSDATIKDGGTITVASAQSIDQLDPYKVSQNWEMTLYHLLWDTLIAYEPGSNELQPQLAASWEASDDLLEYTFSLEPSVTFSNGKPVDAEAVVASLDRALDPKTGFLWAGLIPAAKSIEAVDDETVRFILKEPSSTFLEAISIVPIMDVDALDQVNTDPIGTGPFTVKSFTPGTLELQRNPDYWGEPAHLDGMKIVAAQDPTSAQSGLRSGDIDVLWNVPWADVSTLEGSDGISIVTSEFPSAAALFMGDTTSPPLNDPKVRQALVYATDKETINETAYAGRLEISETNQPISEGNPLFDADQPRYEFDLDKAKELLDEAGIEPGTKLTYWTPAGSYPEWTTYGQILQADYKEIGIDLRIETAEINQWAAVFGAWGHKWPGLIAPDSYGGLPEPITMQYFAPGICQCNFDNAEYNDALTDTNSADESVREAGYATAQRLLGELAPAVIIGFGSYPIAVREGVADVWEDPGTLTRLEDAGLTS